jgi:eukaryotic-like serine/threonine-protein kinase
LRIEEENMFEQLINKNLGRYRIINLLGEGGMGAVFKAHDLTLRRDVAIKVMHPHYARQPAFQERFLQEARTAARLDHPGVVKVFDFGQDHSLLYIVMQFVPGDNLGQMLQDLRQKGKWILLNEGVELVRQVALALDYVHKQGIFHRDIKPGNIMIEPLAGEGSAQRPGQALPYRPILTDLGLAKLAEGGLKTQDGTSMGTPAYMSPEQALGKPSDPRSDVYSLGVLLYELSTGRLPFPARTLTEAIQYHTQETPPPPRTVRPDLPPDLEKIILQSMEKEPASRHADAAVFAKVLEEALPAASQEQAAPTALEGAVSLMTEYQENAGEMRGQSIFAAFDQPSEVTQDRIQVLSGGKTTHSVAIEATGMTIGRDNDNDIVLDDHKASRYHARIEVAGNGYRVIDLDSTNGTFLANARLLPGIPEEWLPERPLRIGDTWLRLLRQRQTQGTIVDTRVEASRIESSAGQGWVGVFMEDTPLTVEPGKSLTTSVVLINQGPVVDQYRVSLEGVPASWLPAAPPLANLMPGDQQEVTLTITPPRSPTSGAGRYPIKLRVASEQSPDQVAEVKSTITVAPFSEFSSELRPQKINAGESAKLTVRNLGNHKETFTLEWKDRGDELAFTPPQAQLGVLEGQSAVAEFRAAPRKQRWFGSPKTVAFTTQVKGAKGKAQTHSGEIISKPVLPAWVIPLVFLLPLFLCLAAFLAYTPFCRTAGQNFPICPSQPVILAFAAEPAELATKGEQVTIGWNVDRAESVQLLAPAINFSSNVDPQGSQSFTLDQSTTFTLRVAGGVGSVEQSIIVLVRGSPPVVQSFTADPPAIIGGRGGNVVLSWVVAGADSISIEGVPGQNLSPSGSLDVPVPAETRTYILVATNEVGTTRQELVVQVTSAGCLVNTAPDGGSLELKQGPGEIYAVITQINHGTPVEQAGRNSTGEWLKVKAAGREGWAPAQFIHCEVDTNVFAVVDPGEIPAPPTLTPTPPTPTVDAGATEQVDADNATATALAAATQTAASLTASAQVPTVTPTPHPNLLAHYPLLENGDDATNNNDPMLLENVIYKEGGIYCNGVFPTFGNPGCWVGLPHVEGFYLNRFTVSMNFRPESSINQPVFLVSHRFHRIGLYLNADGSVSLLHGNNRIDCRTAYSVNEWNSAILTYDGTVANLYINPTLIINLPSCSYPVNLPEVPVSYMGLANLREIPFTIFQGYVNNLLIFNEAIPLRSFNLPEIQILPQQDLLAPP